MSHGVEEFLTCNDADDRDMEGKSFLLPEILE